VSHCDDVLGLDQRDLALATAAAEEMSIAYQTPITRSFCRLNCQHDNAGARPQPDPIESPGLRKPGHQSVQAVVEIFARKNR